MRVVFLLAVLFAVAIPARAQDTLSEIAEQLQQSPIYVGDGFPNVDDAVVSRLNRQLDEDDQILLVLLPQAEYEAFTADDLARDLSEVLGNQHIIGLALGNQVVVYAPILPTGVGTDLMERATSLSNNNPVTALGTFVQNVHKWQSNNPMPTPPPTPVEQTGSESEEGLNWVTYVFGFSIMSALVAFALWFRIVRGRNNRVQAIREQIYDVIRTIINRKPKLTDDELREIIDSLAQDANRFLSDGSRPQNELENLLDRLDDVDAILIKYVDIQDNRKYYPEQAYQLQEGKEAIRDFNEAVLELILQGSERSLSEYRLNTNILKSEREVLNI